MLSRNGVAAEGPLRQGPPGSASVYFDDSEGNHLELVSHGYPVDAPIRPGSPNIQAMRYEWP